MIPLLCFLLVTTGGASGLAGFVFSEGLPSVAPIPADTLQHRHLRVVLTAGGHASIRVWVEAGAEWQIAASLEGDALAGVNAFSPEQPVKTEGLDWRLEPAGPHAVEMTADLNGRVLRRRVSIDTSSAVVHVATSLTLLGNEVVASVFDGWTYPEAELSFAWAPNLRPEPNLVIGEHTFRSPTVILQSKAHWVALVPDLDSLPKLPRQRLAALDLNRADSDLPRFGYGLKAHDPTFHVYYRHDPARVFTYAPGTVTYAYDLLAGESTPRFEVLARVNGHLWDRYGSDYVEDVRPQVLPFAEYGAVSYRTLDSLRQFVEFELNGKVAGAYRAENHGNYFMVPRDIVWNQAWFNAQRSAYGQMFYGLQGLGDDLVDQARKTSAFTMESPDYEGIFPAVYVYERGEWIGSPLRLNGGVNRFHSSSAAWTAVWLWRTYRDFLPMESPAAKVLPLAEFFVRHQKPDGSIPAWFDRDPATGAITPTPTLERSAETAGAAMLLGELASGGASRYRQATLKAADFLIADVLPQMRYFDFETFWSCSWKSPEMRDPYTGILPQNNYSIYWAAETFLYAYRLSGYEKYKQALLETMGLLNLYQQVWNPPFLSLYAFGGFGVMNTDGEWNDSRQAVFAPLYMRVYEATGDEVWMRRGIAALRASFALFAIPENCPISPHTCKAYAPGLSPESLAHGGADGTSGRSDSGWGEAGALAASAYVTRHFGQVYVDELHGKAFGIDGLRVVDVETSAAGLQVRIEEALEHGRPREVVIRTRDGRVFRQWVEPGKIHAVQIPAKP